MKRWKQLALAASGLLIAYGIWTTWNRIFEVEAEPKLTYKHIDGKASSTNYLLEVPIYGPIMVDASDPSLFWTNEATYSVHIQKLLQQASADPRVKGILLRLNTGGGSATGAEAIYNALMNYRKTTQKPVVAYIEEMSASGGVMSMMGAEAIYAAPGSDIGSIGVVDDKLLMYDKLSSYSTPGGESFSSENGIEEMLIFAGKGKDLGHLHRKPTAEELKVMQESVNNIYAEFVQLVAKTRNIPEATIREKMGAYQFGNKQAEKLKLIDGTKHHSEAIADLARRAKIGDDFRVVRAKAPTPAFAWNGYGASILSFEQKQQLLAQDRCTLANSRVLMYYGNPRSLCRPVSRS
jgi:protease-4